MSFNCHLVERKRPNLSPQLPFTIAAFFPWALILLLSILFLSPLLFCLLMT